MQPVLLTSMQNKKKEKEEMEEEKIMTTLAVYPGSLYFYKTNY